MSEMRQFILCADDYAMTPGVSRGILALLDAERISAAGAMTNRPFWRAGAADFAAFSGSADLGLHFNLTCGAPLTAMPRFAPGGSLPKLGSVLLKGIAGQLPEAEIAAELSAQLDAFEDAMGRMPDFVDGHQHVHAMPGVRRAVAKVLAARYRQPRKPYLREAADGLGAILKRGVEVKKAALVAALSAPFGPQMRALGFVTNSGFSGYSDFNPEGDYAAAFARYLVAPGTHHLVMCHPGEVDEELAALDPATGSRPRERDFFLSERFLEICAASAMKPARLREPA
jgi:chitin disaccharide deacetylase